VRSAPHVVLIGAALSANKGAASMLRGAVALARERWPEASVTVLSTYAAADREAKDRPEGLRVVSLSPAQLAGLAAPLALLRLVTRPLRIPDRWFALTPALRALLDADIVGDLAGISFVDGRGLATLVYNTLMSGLGVALGRPVVKLSQAIGPCRRRPTRLAARLVLPRLAAVCSRGSLTRVHLDELGLENVVDAADVAFLMPTSAADAAYATALLPPVPGGRTVGIVPSAVVDRYLARQGGDYRALIGAVIAHFLAAGDRVVLVPHAIRPGSPPSKMNDQPLCEDLAGAHPGVLLVGGDPTPGELREVVARCDVLLTSRFHAMVSALATTTPPVVLGWSHKYQEVLEAFDLRDAAVDYRVVTAPGLVELAERTFDELDARRKTIASRLDEVTRSALRNGDALELASS
jgi:polysaccharide pyruvyl transferase WcaK-like protein